MWPTWNELTQAKAAFNDLQAIDDFPADPEVRLAEVFEEIKGTQEHLDELESDLRASKAERDELQVDDSLAEVAGTRQMQA